jgi:uncharacterized protein involved in exopolysaccharide biosynthesis
MAEEVSLIRRSARPPSPTVRDLLAVFFRQRRLVLICFAGIFLAVLVYGLFAPSYQAEMKVLVRRGRVDPVVTPTPTQSSQFEREEVSEEELNSEVELLRDQEILRTVVRNAGLVPESGFNFRIFGPDDAEVRTARAVEQLSKRLKAEPIRKTTLIAVTYASSDPAQSAKVLRCLANAYLKRHLQLRQTLGEFTFFEGQMGESGRALEEAEVELTNFSSGQGVVSAAMERDLALQKLSEVESSRQQLQVAIAETAERVRMLEAKLQTLPERRTNQIRTADNPQLLEKMKSKLLELELKRTQLLTKFQPSYRLVQEVDEQIAETKAEIAAQNLAPIQDQTTEQDPNHDWAKAELLKAQVELSSLQARSDASGTVLANSRSLAQRLGTAAIKQEGLLRGLKAAEDKYLLYVNKREEARIGDALDERGILNVAIAEQPTVPALPNRSEWSFGFLGLLVAGAFSTGLAFAADRLDPGFRTPDEVVSYLGAPVLASLPRRSTTQGRLS